ncbi:MAG: glycosyltransferase [candidate division WOR-3 bacterium]
MDFKKWFLKRIIRKKKRIKGFLDGIDGQYIFGWAWDPENPEKRLEVLVYVDGEPVAEGVADLYREDLERAGIGDGRHGFRIKLPEKLFKRDINYTEIEIALYEKKSFRLINQKKVILPMIPIVQSISINYEKVIKNTQQSNIYCFIEKGLYIKEINKLIVFGWHFLNKNNNQGRLLPYLKLNDLFIAPIIHFEFYRSDVIREFPYALNYNNGKTGFIYVFDVELDCKNRNIYLNLSGSNEKGVDFEIKNIQELTIFNIEEIIANLMGIYIEKKEDMDIKIESVDIPIINYISQWKKQFYSKLPVSIWKFGKIPERSIASIIIPIYKEFIYIENQMLEFRKDNFLLQECELIYVLDDPEIFRPFLAEVETLYKIYKIPFKVIYGYANRGFSGANNLGAKYANGKFLIFMNSDIIPITQGGIYNMIDFLKKTPDAGAVAPLLLFPNGSIQHMGMKFIWSEVYQTVFNHHINMGLFPEKVIKNEQPIEADMLTGACICVCEDIFKEIGGWPEEYVIGDFEDSDFSLAIKLKGKKLYVLPYVKMYHIEAGSQGFSQDRFKRTLINSYILRNKYKLYKNKFDKKIIDETV